MTEDGYRGIKNIFVAGAGDWAQTIVYMLTDPLRYEGIGRPNPHFEVHMFDQPAQRIRALQSVQSGDVSLDGALEAVRNDSANDLERSVAKYVKCDYSRDGPRDQIQFHELDGSRKKEIEAADLIIMGVSSDGFPYWSKEVSKYNSSDVRPHDEAPVQKFKTEYGITKPVAILTKGIVAEGLIFPTEMIKHHTKNSTGNLATSAVIYGGTIGKQIREYVRSEANVGIGHGLPEEVRDYYAEMLSDLMTLKWFRTTRIHKDDALLMQVGASAKNIYAVGFGMLKAVVIAERQELLSQQGLEDRLGDDYTNLIGLFEPQAQQEMANLYYYILRHKLKLPSTVKPLQRFSQPSFFGDLSTTTNSTNSRNHRGGFGIGSVYAERIRDGNDTPSREVIDQVNDDIGEVVEGIRATQMYYQAIKEILGENKMILRLPILYYTNMVIEGRMLPHEAADVIFNMPRNKAGLRSWGKRS